MHRRIPGIVAAFIIGVTLSTGAAASQLRVPALSGPPLLGPKVKPPPPRLHVPAPSGRPVLNPDLKWRRLFSLTCMAWGSGPNASEIELNNTGTVTIPKGYKVHWKFTFPLTEGDYTFTRSVPPGGTVFDLVGDLSQVDGEGCRVTAAN